LTMGKPLCSVRVRIRVRVRVKVRVRVVHCAYVRRTPAESSGLAGSG
jgi:hypothetical protein